MHSLPSSPDRLRRSVRAVLATAGHEPLSSVGPLVLPLEWPPRAEARQLARQRRAAFRHWLKCAPKIHEAFESAAVLKAAKQLDGAIRAGIAPRATRKRGQPRKHYMAALGELVAALIAQGARATAASRAVADMVADVAQETVEVLPAAPAFGFPSAVTKPRVSAARLVQLFGEAPTRPRAWKALSETLAKRLTKHVPPARK